MPKVTAEIPGELSRQIDRMIRDGWFPDQDAIVREALSHFVDAKTFLGDSPRMLHRFAADALNDSKPEVALKFVNRGLSLLPTQDATDFHLYQNLVELRVQILSSSTAPPKRWPHSRKHGKCCLTIRRLRNGSNDYKG